MPWYEFYWFIHEIQRVFFRESLLRETRLKIIVFINVLIMKMGNIFAKTHRITFLLNLVVRWDGGTDDKLSGDVTRSSSNKPQHLLYKMKQNKNSFPRDWSGFRTYDQSGEFGNIYSLNVSIALTSNILD